MCLIWEYYMLNYRNYKNISKFLNYVKALEEQINATNIKMTSNKQTLLCLIIVLWNKSHYQSLIQIWGMIKDITIEKAQEILLKDKQRLKADFRASILVIYDHDYWGTEAGSCWHYSKTKYKKDSY